MISIIVVEWNSQNVSVAAVNMVDEHALDEECHPGGVQHAQDI
jgi:hypothetical protein